MFSVINRPKKAMVLCILTAFFIILLCIIAGYRYSYLYALPQGCNNIVLYNGCTKIKDNGTFQWVAAQSTSARTYTTNDMRQLAAFFRSLKLEESAEYPTDVQLIEIRYERISDNSFETLENVFIAYDFYTKNQYVYKNGIWYQMEDNKKLNDYILAELKHLLYYRGQSTFNGSEEFYDDDFENATFRYNMRWTKREADGGSPNIQLSGFNNADKVSINSRADAIKRAAEELGYDNPVAVAFYDETCGYYMIEVANDNGNGIVKISNGVIELVEPIVTVVMDDNGRTLEIYEGFTSTRPFWPDF